MNTLDTKQTTSESPSCGAACSPSSLTPETDALRDLYENYEHRATLGDIWELCEGLEINLGNALAIIKGDDEKWRDYYVMPIVAEMKRRGIAEMHVVIKGGKAAYDLIPENTLL